MKEREKISVISYNTATHSSLNQSWTYNNINCNWSATILIRLEKGTTKS